MLYKIRCFILLLQNENKKDNNAIIQCEQDFSHSKPRGSSLKRWSDHIKENTKNTEAN